MEKPVAWPGNQKFSYRTRNGDIKVLGYVVYSVVASTHKRTNVLLCSGSHKITRSHALSDSTGVLHPVTSHDLIIPTATTFKTNLSCCRYARPEDEAGITVSGRGSRRNLERLSICARRAWHRQRPADLWRPRCDCRAIRRTAEEAALSASTHRDALAVKALERVAAAMPRA